MPASARRSAKLLIGAWLATASLLMLARPLAALEIKHITIDGVERSYAIHLPATAANRREVPVVFVLHGAGGHGQQALTAYKWIAKADREGFIVVAPDASRVRPDAAESFLLNPTVWNDGSGRGGPAIVASKDVELIDALIEHLARRYPIDRKRIYATGFSSGASMVQRLGLERARTLAAIAPVSGHFWNGEIRLERGLPVFYLVGNADPLVPYDGGMTRTPWGGSDMPPARQVPAQWAELDGCSGPPRTLEERPQVKAVVWVNCHDRAEVVFYTVDGMGHQWPGGQRGLLPTATVGKYSSAVDATDLIWAFFRRHSLGPADD